MLELRFKVDKVNEEKRLVTAIASVVSKAGGAPIIDAQDDIIDIDDLEEAFVEAFADGGIEKGGEMHERIGGADIVQAFTFSRAERAALHKAGMGIDADGPEFGLVKFRITDDALWARVKSGELSEVSIGATAERVAA